MTDRIKGGRINDVAAEENDSKRQTSTGLTPLSGDGRHPGLYLLKNKYKKGLDKQAYILYNMEARLERYRSGHNEAVLKTVCPKGRMGSNPILSVYYH